MSDFRYKHEEPDEDELLASLTDEELQQLEMELADFETADRVSFGRRHGDQTVKSNCGSFSRGSLQNFWEKGMSQRLDRGWILNSQKRERETREPVTDMERQVNERDGKTNVEDENEDPIELLDSEEDEIQEEEENDSDTCEEDAYKAHDVAERCISHAIKNQWSPEQKAEKTLTPYPRVRPQEREERAGNPTDVEELLTRVLNDEPLIAEVNLNNNDDVTREQLISFAEALRSNTHVEVFSLANTHADDHVAFAIADLLMGNAHIRVLNTDSNYITGKGILALIRALTCNDTLTEIRFHNQRHILGGQVEMEMEKLLRQNTTLLKLGYQFHLAGPRATMTGILTRNQDFKRQRRLQIQRNQKAGSSAAHRQNDQRARNTPKSSCEPPKSPAKSTARRLHQIKVNVPAASPHPPPPPPPPPSPPPSSTASPAHPTRKIAEVIKLQRNGVKEQVSQEKSRSKRGKEVAAKEKEAQSILQEVKKELKPIMEKESQKPSLPQCSAHDALMAAIRASSIRSLKRVEVPQYLR